MRKDVQILSFITATALALAACAPANSGAHESPTSAPTPSSAPPVPNGGLTSDDYMATIAALKAAQSTPQGEVPTAAAKDSDKVKESLAWHQDTNMDGIPATPIGGLGTTESMIVETWGKTPDGNKGFVAIVPAGAVMWLQNHFGGTGVWVDQLPKGMSVVDLANQHADNIKQRDGTRPEVVNLPGTTADWPKGGFPLLGCLQTKPVNGDVRHCDPVGGLPGYDAPAALPKAGFFRGY